MLRKPQQSHFVRDTASGAILFVLFELFDERKVKYFEIIVTKAILDNLKVFSKSVLFVVTIEIKRNS